MNLTKDEAIKLHRELWGWLTENPMKRKEDWPGWEKHERVQLLCFCCEFADRMAGSNGCKNCPLVWPELFVDSERTPCGKSYFCGWDNAKLPEERSRLAALIRDLPEKKIEKPAPKYQIGDKVVPAGMSWVNWTLEKYQNYHSDIPDFLRKNGYLCVSTVKDGEYQYLCGTDNLRGQDRFKESELIPYIEPPKYKFAVGDKVRAIAATNGWDTVKAGDIGTITHTPDMHPATGSNLYRADFPNYKNWNGKESCFELVVDEPKEVKPEPVKPFGVGDRVKTKLGIGIIKDICNGFLYGVEFQKELSNGSRRWNNNFPQKINFGWYFYKRDMEFFPPINVAPENKTFIESGATFILNGSTTVCIIEAAGRKFKGIAKCEPKDAWDETTGKGWAGIRALRKVLDATEKELRKR